MHDKTDITATLMWPCLKFKKKMIRTFDGDKNITFAFNTQGRDYLSLLFFLYSILNSNLSS